MAEFGERLTYTMKAAADLSAVQYHIVRRSAAGVTNIASLATNTAMIGVLQNKPAAENRAATIAYAGLSKVVAGTNAVTDGDLITTNGSGRADVAGSGDMVCGRALSTSANDGEVITAVLYPPYKL